MTSLNLRSLATWLFVQEIPKLAAKKYCIIGPLGGKSTSDWWISLTKAINMANISMLTHFLRIYFHFPNTVNISLSPLHDQIRSYISTCHDHWAALTHVSLWPHWIIWIKSSELKFGAKIIFTKFQLKVHKPLPFVSNVYFISVMSHEHMACEITSLSTLFSTPCSN